MGKLMTLQHLSFRYPESAAPTLDDLSFTVERGDFITLVGATGSGKTTLLKQLKPELQPAGTRTGQLRLDGQPLSALTGRESVQRLGYVAQDPQTQPIMATVIEELAFSLENLGLATADITTRVAELANFLGLDQLLNRPIDDLSGGQLQLVNLASVLALKPDILLLDEPTAQLDPTTAQHFLAVLQQVHDELGLTIILTEHRLSSVLAMSNRLMLLRDGRLAYDGPVAAGLVQMNQLPELQAFVPPVPEFFLAHDLAEDQLPLTVQTGRQLIRQAGWAFDLVEPTPHLQLAAEPLVTAKGLVLSYPEHTPTLQQLNLTVGQGDWLAIIGKNGSGKSTLLSILAGLRKPQHGRARLGKTVIWRLRNADRLARIGYLSQNPTEQFSGETVAAELRQQAELVGVSAVEPTVAAMLRRLQLTAVADRNAFDLSGGQQQLLGLGLALIGEPQVLLLDEPTKGLDPTTKQQIGRVLQQAHAAGLTLIMASHDMDFCAEFATTCAFMFDGRLSQQQPTRTFFTHNFLATTAVNRLLRQQVPQALFWRDVHITLKGGDCLSKNDDNLTGA
ncbi:ABC transporter ATP-binding protein [Levilactobacillus sp. HBUAS70063]|uniref:ABC transporter ATP-binding protein n=1 Tax=Levilactobacillus sp. HBUAS70063 TaxID=3109359 RepID=UPI003133358B